MRLLFAVSLLSVALILAAGPAAAAAPTSAPMATSSASPDPAASLSPLVTPDPSASPGPSLSPEPSASPTPTPSPTPSPSQDPGPTPSPTTTPGAPASLSLFVSSGFRFQNPNYAACTATTVMDILNFIALRHSGGEGFRWQVSTAAGRRDTILGWERTHDTLAGGRGSDPHGVRNALNFYGWGSARLWSGARIYEDRTYGSYAAAARDAVRAMAHFRKPVAIAAWGGNHVQMLTGYYGLVGDPFARDSSGRYRDAFTVAGFYLTDPLRSGGYVHRQISYASLATSANRKLRFGPYYATDSPYDDHYTPGYRPARDEWYRHWVSVVPIR